MSNRRSQAAMLRPRRDITPPPSRPEITPEITTPPPTAPIARAQSSVTEIRYWNPPGLSLAEQFTNLPNEERESKLASLNQAECDAMNHDWGFWQRPSQKLPPGQWVTWMVKAGRGWGKTRVGSETVRIWVRNFPMVNLIGATADDARDIMIEGESGILAICPQEERPVYRKTERKLLWPNGAISLVFTADEPERLRGKQHMKLWSDEIASWRYPESWDQAMLGLRLGPSPQSVVTTTPKPSNLVKNILYAPTTIVTQGTTYQNRRNLSNVFLSQIISKYEGTRMGRQELNAELLEANPNGLWRQEDIDNDRVDPDYFWRELYPALARTIVAIDPAASSNADSDETGIVTVGRDGRSPCHFYVFDDRSDIHTPEQWGRKAIDAYRAFKADRVVGEMNNGGEMVEATLRNIDPNVPYKALHASKGKITRAEPVAALYEQHRVHHVGVFGALEDQCTDYDPATAEFSPDRMDALVWGVTELMEGMDTLGLVDYMKHGHADTAIATIEASIMSEMTKIATGGHAGVVVNAKTTGCPKCEEKIIQRVSGQLRCAACGYQWWPGKPPETSRSLMKRDADAIDNSSPPGVVVPAALGGVV